MSKKNGVVNCDVLSDVARITLNRPDKRNALNDEMIDGLFSALSSIEADPAVRIALLSGEGKDFCAGADLSALRKISELSIYDNLQDADRLASLFLRIRAISIPIVAVVRGRALAGGCGLAAACDMVIASENARFGFPEVKIGFVPAIVTAILRRNVSEKIAFELISTGRELSAVEAVEAGFVNHAYADDLMDLEIEKVCSGLIRNSKSAIALSKRLLYQMDGMTFQQAVGAGVDINAIARMTEDCKKGVDTFLHKSTND